MSARLWCAVFVICAAGFLWYQPVEGQPRKTGPVKVASNKIAGNATFSCDFKAAYLEEKGYVFVREGRYKQYVTNVFGAANVELVIKNAEGVIVGTATTDRSGKFDILVPDSTFYEITGNFHGIAQRKVAANASAKEIEIQFGRFLTDQVKQWNSD